MAKYLLYDEIAKELVAVDFLPPGYGHITVCNFPIGNMNVYYKDNAHLKGLNNLMPFMNVLLSDYVQEAKEIADDLMGKYNDYGFISLGHSPKVVKWWMKKLGAKRVIFGPDRRLALREIKFRLFRKQYARQLEKKIKRKKR